MWFYVISSHFNDFNKTLTHWTYIIHMVKLIFKAYKKTGKTFFMIFSLFIKMLTRILSKKQRKTSKKKACERY